MKCNCGAHCGHFLLNIFCFVFWKYKFVNMILTFELCLWWIDLLKVLKVCLYEWTHSVLHSSPLVFPTHRLLEEESTCLTLPRARDTDRKSEERRQVRAGWVTRPSAAGTGSHVLSGWSSTDTEMLLNGRIIRTNTHTTLTGIKRIVK